MKVLNVSLLSVILLFQGCGGSSTGANGDDSSSSVETTDDFHADNDIAMTVRSIADAIRVGEPLDTTFYNFDGVLTDGTGRPLYTNIKGIPGGWNVDVLSETSAVVRNVDIGDLVPDDLESYLANALELNGGDIIDLHECHGTEDAETTVYDFGGGYLRIEVRNATAPNGLEGPLINITITRDLPSH